MNRYAIVFRKRVGNHLKFFAVKSNVAGCRIAKMFDVSAHFRHGGRFKIASRHDIPIIGFRLP